ncbi:Oxoglutarate/iron-dependent dioxygenase [uncultured Caudovirales phage]|uniref:Oxoglutarate/iron-dependent dioxygenase n=1 Tax=uncultured Caudovirales phage TaxID=2100421 RepID=A0A6J7WMU7_9CAUD|nr:Oxoglutarate/iron-dependent dioxygenase [uncultured Caudovirales phage]
MLEIKDFYKIDDKIYVYQNMFNDQYFIECFNYITELKDLWKKWHIFGEQLNFPFVKTTPESSFQAMQYEDFKKDIKFDSESDEKIKYFYNYIEDVFYATTKEYFKNPGIKQPDGLKKFHHTPSLMKYVPNLDFDVLTMRHHVDFQQELIGVPSDKFLLTCNMYLNDNYKGGEVSFKVFKNNLNESNDDFDHYLYTPKMGDVVVFPSNAPYYHGVRPTINGVKYFVRSFYMYEDPGSQEWHANKEKYGEETWLQMEKLRQEEERKSGIYIKDRWDKPNYV